MKQSQQLLKAYYVVDLIKSLRKKGIGLASVEKQSYKICKDLQGSKRDTLVKTVMSWKLKDAYRKLSKERRNNTKVWREVKQDIDEERVLKDYVILWKREKEWSKTKLNDRRRKKVKFLTKKYGKRFDVPDTLEGITVRDREIPTAFSSEPRCYGECKINTSENQALCLPPKFAVYTKVESGTVEAQIEKGLAMYRWAKVRDKDEGKEQNQVQVYDRTSKTIDMRKMRATDLPFNKRIVLPSPLETAEEKDLQHLKCRLIYGNSRGFY